MLTDDQYRHFRKCIRKILNHQSRYSILGDKEFNFFNTSGVSCDLEYASAILIFDNTETMGYEIQIHQYSIVFDFYKKSAFDTEMFKTNSDEEFFQTSTLQDTSFIDETFLRELIDLSLLLRKNIKESKNVTRN